MELAFLPLLVLPTRHHLPRHSLRREDQLGGDEQAVAQQAQRTPQLVRVQGERRVSLQLALARLEGLVCFAV